MVGVTDSFCQSKPDFRPATDLPLRLTPPVLFAPVIKLKGIHVKVAYMADLPNAYNIKLIPVNGRARLLLKQLS